MIGPSGFNSFFYGSFGLRGSFWWTYDQAIAALPADFPPEVRRTPLSFCFGFTGLAGTPVEYLYRGMAKRTLVGGWTVVGLWDSHPLSLDPYGVSIFAYQGTLTLPDVLAALIQDYPSIIGSDSPYYFLRASGGQGPFLVFNSLVPETPEVITLDGVLRTPIVVTSQALHGSNECYRRYTFTLGSNRSIAFAASPLTSYATLTPIRIILRDSDLVLIDEGNNAYTNLDLAAGTYFVDFCMAGPIRSGYFEFTPTDNGVPAPPIVGTAGNPDTTILLDGTPFLFVSQFPSVWRGGNRTSYYFAFTVPLLATGDTEIFLGANAGGPSPMSDTFLYLASGASYTGQSILASNDDSGSFPWNSYISMTGVSALIPGQTYMIECTYFSNVAGEYDLQAAILIT